MWIIIGIVILVVICYVVFSKTVNKIADNTVNSFEENKWWTIGMIADMHNKRKDKK